MNFFVKGFKKLVEQEKKHWKQDVWWLIVILLVMAVFVFSQNSLPTREEVDAWMDQYGSWGPLVVIGLIVVETIIAPIPGTFIPIIIGAFFGYWPGILLAWIGNLIGGTIAFYISRFLGRPVVRKIISEEKLSRYDKFIHQRKIMLYVAYAMPLLPLDIISFSVGLSQVPYKRFFGALAIGFAINLSILTLFGERIITATGGERIIWGALAAVFILAAAAVERVTSANNDKSSEKAAD